MTTLPRALRTAISPTVSALTLVLVAAPACNDSGSTPRIVAVTPDFAFSDGEVTLTVEAPGTRPSLLVDLDSQSATFEPTSVQLFLVPSDPDGRVTVPLSIKKWLKAGRFLAGMSPGVAAGTYDVKMVAPNGRSGTMPRAFVCGGHATTGPMVLVTSPTKGQVVTAGDGIRAAFTVDDYGGQLVDVSWATLAGVTGTCVLPANKETGDPPATFDTASNGDCAVFPTPSSGTFTTASMDFGFSVTATDVSGYATTVDVPLILAQLPVITSFKNTVGKPEGRQEFTVLGRFFPPGAEASIGGVRILDRESFAGTGGVVVNDMTIIGLTPPNKRPETLDVTVSTPWGAVGTSITGFRYTLPPLIRVIQPPTGPAAGGINMTIVGNDLRAGVTIKFGVTLEDAKNLPQTGNAADSKVTGLLPPGHGTVSVWAVDEITGTGQAVDGFTYVEDTTVGQPVPSGPADPASPADGGVAVTAPGATRPRSP